MFLTVGYAFAGRGAQRAAGWGKHARWSYYPLGVKGEVNKSKGSVLNGLLGFGSVQGEEVGYVDGVSEPISGSMMIVGRALPWGIC